ncbi:JmjC domain-containing protein 4 [Chamberlinius hualienensis]
MSVKTDYFLKALFNSSSLSVCEDDPDAKNVTESVSKSISVLNASCKQNCTLICQCQTQCLKTFYVDFMQRNVPCIVTKEMTAKWKSVREWIKEDGSPDFHYLTTHFGMTDVPVADCDDRYYNSQKKCTMKFKDYISYWKQLILDDYDFKIHGNLYLKDWHFTKDFPNYNAYEVPSLFQSDWLNEFWSLRNDSDDDYRFVYMGPKGSWTPLHVDVFHSYSWSANLCGRKLWIMFPPEEYDNLKDRRGNLPFNVQSSAVIDDREFPGYKLVTKRYEVIQGPGQIIFVPSGWIHQVHNLEDTISINHNWFNGFNIDCIWKALVTALKNVENEIIDCKDMENWDEQCQLITRSTHGMDVREFGTLIKSTAESKLKTLEVIRSHHKENLQRELDFIDQLNNHVKDGPNFTNRGKSVTDMLWEEAQLLFELAKIRDLFEEIMKNKLFLNIMPYANDLHEIIHNTITR